MSEGVGNPYTVKHGMAFMNEIVKNLLVINRQCIHGNMLFMIKCTQHYTAAVLSSASLQPMK